MINQRTRTRTNQRRPPTLIRSTRMMMMMVPLQKRMAILLTKIKPLQALARMMSMKRTMPKVATRKMLLKKELTIIMQTMGIPKRRTSRRPPKKTWPVPMRMTRASNVRMMRAMVGARMIPHSSSSSSSSPIANDNPAHPLIPVVLHQIQSTTITTTSDQILLLPPSLLLLLLPPTKPKTPPYKPTPKPTTLPPWMISTMTIPIAKTRCSP
mmetsp:Transcript_13417/g.24642  ORF Transcript_13417/g.24642 Transcript_13417/m.24642 type:complete len:211 (-) Transcript_13417:1415-2047(-)